ncbi:evolutionarily conserved C-terminal region 6 [Actinidia rufa]|uniref:YTH domain-containing family protein n=1 Tax=Actinidia rufa TaxID=165716 RepID=A0A7J0GL89_9ERIC|nr:evolutionarily conserved C-terminal region 6 [Actinidia rufa]
MCGGNLGMEMYNFPDGNSEAYLIQGTKSNPHLTSPPLESFGAMYNEGAPEFVLEQGLYYPPTTNYGYNCTGFESPSNWDDHHRIFGLDGEEVLYAFPYNPYNTNIPGAMLGTDDPFIGMQKYYNIPYYEYPISSPTGFPMVFQSGPEFIPSHTTEPYLNTGFTANRTGGPNLNSFTANRTGGLKNNFSWASATLPTVPKPASNQTCFFARVSEGPKANAGPRKLPAAQGRGVHAVDNISQGKAVSHGNELKVPLSSSNGLSNFGSSAHGWPMEKIRSKFHFGRVANDVNGSRDALIEQNRGPRTIKSKNHLAVKAYTTRTGESDTQGNIIIYTDQYNKVDFSADYVNAKFFVIKSYSEDDVHKGIKYNVWSSTTNGNKKLQSAYEDARRIAAGEPRGCPIFLFFSVNASGQLCSVAEMTGPVDFHKNMDFWQQNKWSGNFPVRWHMIEDVTNPNFRHIILENNENKPVTNSRDTQEVCLA